MVSTVAFQEFLLRPESSIAQSHFLNTITMGTRGRQDFSISIASGTSVPKALNMCVRATRIDPKNQAAKGGGGAEI